MSRRYRITHHTRYSYDQEVTDSYGMACVRPKQLPGQEVIEYELWTDPGHADLGAHLDLESNELCYFHVTEPHAVLQVSMVSVVEVTALPRNPIADAIAWEDARPTACQPSQGALATEYAYASPLVDVVPAARDYANPSFTPERDLVAAALDLMHRIHAEFQYLPGATTITTRVLDVLERGQGVCQDFAHLMISCLRSLGLAARYVSGYLATDPPPGRDRVVGADATHAWIEVWMPGSGWLALDPTNDCVVGDRHITVAHGRDYGDVPPVKGVIFTEATGSVMTVSVDVARLDPPS